MFIQPKTNTLYCGDNLAIMRAMPDELFDLIYIDPPFFTQRDYKNNTIDNSGFKDTKDFFEYHIQSDAKGLLAYLEWVNVRLLELHRILKHTGTIYVHVDYHAVHYIKIILDKIFGYKNIRNEIIWVRGNVKGAKAVGNQFARNHDSILYYTKSDEFTYNRQYIPYSDEYIENTYVHDDGDGRGLYQTQPLGTRSKEGIAKLRKEGRIFKTTNGRERVKYYLNQMNGVAMDDVWTDILEVQSNSKEKTGWPTQKPIALLERIIRASSNEGDIVFDCFTGGGTTMTAAHNLKRRWVGIDISPEAINISKTRLEEAKASVEVITEIVNPITP